MKSSQNHSAPSARRSPARCADELEAEMTLEQLDVETLHTLATALWTGNGKMLGRLDRAYQRRVAMLAKVIRQAGGTFRKDCEKL